MLEAAEIRNKLSGHLLSTLILVLKKRFFVRSAQLKGFVPRKQSGNVRKTATLTHSYVPYLPFFGDVGTIYVHPLEYPRSFRFAACEDFIATVTFIRSMNLKISVLENMGSGQCATRAHSNHS
jgi:hypothetical protein